MFFNHSLSSPFLPRDTILAVVGCGILHSLGMVHRDLKPENILLSLYNQGQEVVVKIADFGFTREVDSTVVMTYCGCVEGGGEEDDGSGLAKRSWERL